MNADARHGGLRQKRCLPAKFHPKTAHHYRLNLKIKTTRFPQTDSCFKFPKSRQTIVTAPKRANSRFFTNCYPISAVFTPKVNQIGPRSGATLALISHRQTYNSSFNISCLLRTLRPFPGEKQRSRLQKPGPFSSLEL